MKPKPVTTIGRLLGGRNASRRRFLAGLAVLSGLALLVATLTAARNANDYGLPPWIPAEPHWLPPGVLMVSGQQADRSPPPGG